MTDQHMATLEIFEDLYRANMRASIFELEQCMQSMELLPRPRGVNQARAEASLRDAMQQSLTTMEVRLAALRTRYAALPQLQTKKDEVDDAN